MDSVPGEVEELLLLAGSSQEEWVEPGGGHQRQLPDPSVGLAPETATPSQDLDSNKAAIHVVRTRRDAQRGKERWPETVSKRIDAIVEEFSAVWATHLTERPLGTAVKPSIRLRTDVAPFKQVYPPSPRKLAALQQLVAKLQAIGAVRRVGASEHISGVTVVPKKDGQWRLVNDLRLLNAGLVAYPTPVADVRKLIPRLEGAVFFSTFDLLQAFFQVPLESDSQSYTAFQVGDELYVFTRLPMGLSCSPYWLECVLQEVLADLVLGTYADNVLLWGKSHEELLDRVTAFLARCRDRHVLLKAEDVVLCTEVADFCGFEFSAKGWRRSRPARTLGELPPLVLENAAQLSSVIGLLNYAALNAPRAQLRMQRARTALNRIAQRAGGRRDAAALRNHVLADQADWDPTIAEELRALWQDAVTAAAWAYPKPGWPLAILSDASTAGYGWVVLTYDPAARGTFKDRTTDAPATRLLAVSSGVRCVDGGGGQVAHLRARV